MCIAIASKKPETYFDNLKEAWENNPHGAGIAFIEDERVKVVKGLMTLKELEEAIETHKAHLDGKPHLVHLRVTTSGKTNKANTHPWELTDQSAMIHNGVLPYRTTAKASDTRLFAAEVLSPLLKRQPEALHSEWFRKYLEAYLGKRNAMAFLDARSGQVLVFNESGRGGDGVKSSCGSTWFSNKSHIPNNWSAWRRKKEGALYLRSNHTRTWNDTTQGWEWDDYGTGSTSSYSLGEPWSMSLQIGSASHAIDSS